ncbi:MAG: response regulator, partial [Proteobacteria bacterium]|nr:response regulator [Pseudomonadota bacterium]
QTVGAVLERSPPAAAKDFVEHDIAFTYQSPHIEDARRAGAVILAAEDNTINQRVLGNQMERLGYHADFAEDGVEALAMLEKNPARYGLLLTDCHMPRLDGYDLTQTIRDAEAARGGYRLPIVALTANALHGEADRCLEAGMDDYLSKPVDLSDLDNTIFKWLPKAVRMRSKTETNTSVAEKLHSPAKTQMTEAKANECLDPKLLIEATGGNLDIAGAMLTDFINATEQQLDLLADAVKDGNAIELKKIAHSMKGSSKTVGANRLADAAYYLEQKGSNSDMADTDTILAALRNDFVNVQQGVRDFIDESAT